MDIKEKIRRIKIKLKSEWRRLGLKKTWFIFVPITIIWLVHKVLDYTLWGCLFALAGVISIYYLFLRNGLSRYKNKINNGNPNTSIKF